MNCGNVPVTVIDLKHPNGRKYLIGDAGVFGMRSLNI